MQWLSFVASDFHKAFVPAFRAESMVESKDAQAQVEDFAKKNIIDYLGFIEHGLQDKKFISGNRMTVADCYLFTILRWCDWVDINISEYKLIQSYMERMSHLPGIKKALELEDE